MNKKNVTSQEYITLEKIFNYLNNIFFGANLPPCLITLQRKSKVAGYYHQGRFISRSDKDIQIDEIALNPDVFFGMPDIEIISTIAHEMVHLWQFNFGKPSRTGYHNKEFSVKMKDIGLQTSSTGKPGGKETGQKMSDYIITKGIFETSIKEYLKSKKGINWQSIPISKNTIDSKKMNKIKYSCPDCNLNVWGKPGILVKCGKCEVLLMEEG